MAQTEDYNPFFVRKMGDKEVDLVAKLVYEIISADLDDNPTASEYIESQRQKQAIFNHNMSALLAKIKELDNAAKPQKS